MPTGVYSRKVGVYPRTPKPAGQCQRTRLTLLGQKHPPERIEANRLGQIRRFKSPTEREKARRARAEHPNKHPLNPETCKLRSKLAKARWANPEWKARVSLILKEAANKPEVKAKQLHRLRTALNKHVKPNKPETELLNLLNTYFPNQWKYTGNWDFMIGHRNPDFVNINGHKQIIELFGAYWHSIFDIATTINFYKQYGFSTLIIWEDELENKSKVITKVRRFMRR